MTYEEFVASRVKHPMDIDRSTLAASLQHMLMGIMGEVGELTDAIKRHIVYGQALDLDNVREELGDLEFYLEGLRQALYPFCGMTREDILEHNMEKLTLRYPEKYSDECAAERADKVC